MAGQAAKKQSKTASQTIVYYFYATLIASALHIAICVLRNYDSITKLGMFGSAFLLFVSRFTYSSIATALEMGVSYSWYQDIFLINTAVQLLTTISNYFWALYLLVPVYFSYKMGRMVINWVFSPSINESDPAYLKRKEKLERKIRQGHVKVLK